MEHVCSFVFSWKNMSWERFLLEKYFIGIFSIENINSGKSICLEIIKPENTTLEPNLVGKIFHRKILF